MIPDFEKGVIRTFLEPGEEILWHGKPLKGDPQGLSTPCAVVFASGWTLFSLIWEAAAVASFIKDPGFLGAFMILFGLPFLGIGIFLLSQGLYVEKQLHRNTYYAVTDRRVLTLRGINIKNLKFEMDIPLDSIVELRRHEQADGVGKLEILDIRYHASSSSYRGGVPSFSNIRGVSTVHRLIQEKVDAVRAFDYVESEEGGAACLTEGSLEGAVKNPGEIEFPSKYGLIE